MSKNILLATINSTAIKNLSTFSLFSMELVKITNRYNDVRKAVQHARKNMLSFVSVFNPNDGTNTASVSVYRINSGESDEIVLGGTRNVYSTNGIVNLPVNIYTASGKTACYSVEECNSYLDKIEGQMKARKAEALKSYNEAIRNTIPDGAYLAYTEGMKNGSFDNRGKATFSFNYYVSAMLRNMGIMGADDEKAVRKLVTAITLWQGGRYTLKNGLQVNSEATFSKVLMQAFIDRCLEKNVLTLTPQGYRKLSKEEAEARKTA